MATVMQIDLRAPAPHYTLTHDPDRTVGSVSAGGLDGLIPGNVGTRLLQEAQDRLRADNPGPQTLLGTTTPNMGYRNYYRALAEKATTQKQRQDLLAVSRAEGAYAVAMAEAQQVVQVAAMRDDSHLFGGSAPYQTALVERARMAQAAAWEFNLALPRGYDQLRKSVV
jgi:hypothetical protein